MSERRRRFIALSVRARTVLAAMIVMAAAAAGGSILLVRSVTGAQLRGVDRALGLQVDTVVGLAGSGALPNPVPTDPSETSLVQVVGSGGRIIAQSASIAGEGVLFAGRGGPTIAFHTVPQAPVGSGGAFRVASERVDTPGGPVTVYAATALADVNRAADELDAALVVGGPVIVLFVGLLSWLIVGRALSPVERIRAEVAEITAGELHRRVALPAARDEVGRLASTMNDMLGRLEQSARRQQSFVSDASHELRSPLAVAQADLEVALTHDPGSAWPDTARSTLGELERMRRIVDDLLVLARYDENASVAAPVQVDLDEIVLGEIARLRSTAPVELDSHEVSGGRVLGDPEQLGRAVRNLLDNAVRHARSKVTITLGTSEESVVELTVADDGPGVAENDRTRIFERFGRSDQGRARSHGGTGLGLAIVKEIVTSHGGEVTLGDTVAGALFIVALPAVPQTNT